MAMAAEPRREARALIEEIGDDPTSRHVSQEIPDDATILVVGWPSLTVNGLPQRGDVEVLVLDVEGQANAVVRRLSRADMEVESVDPAHVAGAVDEADLVIVEVGAMGDVAALVDVGNLPAVAVARLAKKPVWFVAGVGRHLPEQYFTEIVDRVTDPDLPAFINPYEIISLSLADRLATPKGVILPTELGRCATPFAPELLARLQ